MHFITLSFALLVNSAVFPSTEPLDNPSLTARDPTTWTNVIYDNSTDPVLFRVEISGWGIDPDLEALLEGNGGPLAAKLIQIMINFDSYSTVASLQILFTWISQQRNPRMSMIFMNRLTSNNHLYRYSSERNI